MSFNSSWRSRRPARPRFVQERVLDLVTFFDCLHDMGDPVGAARHVRGRDGMASRPREQGPTPQKLGFIYMLRGDNGASNTDPYATEEKPDNNWVTTGSHVMIVGADAKALLQAYPRDPKPDPHKPYVMWAGSPYEHLMLPVQ